MSKLYVSLWTKCLCTTHTHTHTHPFNGPFSGTTRVSRYQKGKTNLDFTEARDSECSSISWAICKSAPCSRQTTTPAPNHSFLQAGCPSCHPTNSVKALKEFLSYTKHKNFLAQNLGLLSIFTQTLPKSHFPSSEWTFNLMTPGRLAKMSWLDST